MSKPDEKAIERDFCAGVLSLQAVADKYGITIKALCYMAGKKGWIRAKGAGTKAGQKNGAKKVMPQKNQLQNNHRIWVNGRLKVNRF